MTTTSQLLSPFPDDARVSVGIHGDAAGILAELKISLVVSANPLRVFCLGTGKSGQLCVDVLPFFGPFGIHVDRGRLAIASRYTITLFNNVPHMAASYPPAPDTYETLFAPRNIIITGPCRTHDVHIVGNGVLFANTQFSCLSHCSGDVSFTPVWKPPFISEIMPEDRCHLNSFAIGSDGKPAYATVFAATDAAAGYRDRPVNSGLLLNIASGAVVATGLTLPHSPRVFEDGLYLCNSGLGDVLRIDAAKGTADHVARLPGFTRGLRAYGDFLFVGLSSVRNTHRDIPIVKQAESLITGIAIIERRTGKLRGILEFPDTVAEVMDFDIVPGCRRVLLQDAGGADGYCAVETPGNSFWTPIERPELPTADERAEPTRPSSFPQASA